MDAASLTTTLVAFAAGFWVHNNYLKGSPLWIVVVGTLLFGEVFKWVTGIETFPLKISQKVRDKTTQDLAQLY